MREKPFPLPPPLVPLHGRPPDEVQAVFREQESGARAGVRHFFTDLLHVKDTTEILCICSFEPSSLHAHVQDLELGALQDDEVLVRLVATGVCHTDLDLAHINEALEDQETGRVIKPIIKF